MISTEPIVSEEQVYESKVLYIKTIFKTIIDIHNNFSSSRNISNSYMAYILIAPIL